MHNTLKKWLEELEGETTIIISEEINEEANGNMVSFGFTQDLLKEWQQTSVIAFLSACMHIYQKKSNDHSMLFYSWFDEQAGQIRISAVSQTHRKLPFVCSLNRVSIDTLVQGIYNGDSGLFTKKALNIYQQNI